MRREWRSYLPDGRPIRVRRLSEGWEVVCEHRTETSGDLTAAMHAALGLADVAEIVTRENRELLLRWVQQHSALIERES